MKLLETVGWFIVPSFARPGSGRGWQVIAGLWYTVVLILILRWTDFISRPVAFGTGAVVGTLLISAAYLGRRGIWFGDDRSRSGGDVDM